MSNFVERTQKYPNPFIVTGFNSETAKNPTPLYWVPTEFIGYLISCSKRPLGTVDFSSRTEERKVHICRSKDR